MNPPKHIAIIMDGNGRWANARKHNRVYGHIRGAKVAYNIIKHCAQSGIKNLTLFAFSTENWQRPKNEVSLLMSLLIKHLKKEMKTLVDNNIKFNTIGDVSELPPEVQELITDTKRNTQQLDGLNLTFALNYGGQQDILHAFKKIIALKEEGKISGDDINQELISKYLQSAFLPNPDLIIRTSNEKRLSNFFLWQSAYSEFYFTEKCWPDFSTNDFDLAIAEYLGRNRRFGKVPSTPTRESNNLYG